ncbi:MAG TPA: DUF624 domain-containing protein [Arachnia sp.]|nr:DUF624 domain-containing protein [Arachnia sp.]HMT84761.1 DUF624 domain-containing protein [Arachnia sp.]
MRNLFNADSPLMRFLNRFADFMLINLLFIATSLPLVTLGASLSALSATAIKQVKGEDESLFADYLASFKNNLRQGTVIGLICGFLVLVLGAWYIVIDNLNINEIFRLLLWIAFSFVAFRVGIMLLYVFPYQGVFDDNIRTVFRNARLMSLRHLPSSLMMAIVLGLPVVVTVFYPQVIGYGLLWLLVGFSAIAYANATFFVRIFAAYAHDF